jgi:phosphatidylglycerol:prolipoprotein diacylglycerol transferase
MHPILYEIHTPWRDVPVYSYGVMLGTSMIVAWYVVMVLGEKKEGFSRDVMATTFIFTAIAAIVGSRVLYIATNPDEFHDIATCFKLWDGGLVAYGGFLGGLLGAWLYLRRRPDATLLGWADIVAPTLGLGLGFTRIGCYLFGCDFGAPLSGDAPEWLRTIGTFPRHADGSGSPAFRHHVEQYDLSPLAEHSLPVHPTQLYESVAGFALAAVCFWVWQRRRFRGQVILTLTILYGIWRFLIEYVRDDPERGFYFGFSTSQLISIALVPLCALLYQVLRQRQGDTPLVAGGVAPEASPIPKEESDAAPRSETKKRKKAKKKG